MFFPLYLSFSKSNSHHLWNSYSALFINHKTFLVAAGNSHPQWWDLEINKNHPDENRSHLSRACYTGEVSHHYLCLAETKEEWEGLVVKAREGFRMPWSEAAGGKQDALPVWFGGHNRLPLGWWRSLKMWATGSRWPSPDCCRSCGLAGGGRGSRWHSSGHRWLWSLYSQYQT